jgi:hypothetical protein
LSMLSLLFVSVSGRHAGKYLSKFHRDYEIVFSKHAKF